MLNKNIQPLDLRDLEDSEIEHSLKSAFEDFKLYWEKHGPFLLARIPYNDLANFYAYANDSLKWLEGSN